MLHGHAHNGCPEAKTISGTPVYNVSMSLLQQRFPDEPAFRLIELTVPDATVAEVGIGRISGGNLPIPRLAIPDVAFPNTAVGEIRSRDVDVRAVGQTVVFNAGGGLLRISLRVIPEAHVRIAEMMPQARIGILRSVSSPTSPSLICANDSTSSA